MAFVSLYRDYSARSMNNLWFVLWLMENHDDVDQDFVVLFLLFHIFLSSKSKSTMRNFRFDLDSGAVMSFSINLTINSKLYIGSYKCLTTAISDQLQA